MCLTDRQVDEVRAVVRVHAIDPRPFDDELLYSILARTRDLLGVEGSLGFLWMTCGTEAASFRVGLPGDLAALALGICPQAGLTADTLMQRHTLFPYFSRFLSGEAHSSAVAHMRGGWPRGGYENLGYMHDARHWPARLRLCRDCVRADVEEGSAAGWRRTHQLPGVFVCPWHGSPLRATEVTLASQARLVPCPDGPDSYPQVACPIGASAALRIARGTDWLLRNPGHPVPAGVLQEAMRSAIGDRGWLGPNGMARPGFVGALEESYGRAVLASMGVAFGSRTSRKAAQRLWGRTGEPGTAPLACLLALDFLETDVSELFARCAGRFPAAAGPGQRNNPRPATLQRHRDTLAWTVRSNRKLGRAGIRAACNTSYCYLNRNDPEWLDANLPAKRRSVTATDWKAMDRRLAREARDAIDRLRSMAGRPRRLTFARIAALMGLRTTLSRRDARLPATVSAIQDASETRSRFRERMLHRAAAECCREAVVPTWSGFARLAGFKACEFPHLEKLARDIHAGCGDVRRPARPGPTLADMESVPGPFVPCISPGEDPVTSRPVKAAGSGGQAG